jgi:multicomponent Na+:H+ antiporter subunit E
VIGFLWNIILAFIWDALTGEISVSNFILGFGIGFLILFFLRRVVSTGSYTIKVIRAVTLVLIVMWDILIANLNVAWHVITPPNIHKPGIIQIPLDVKTDAEITILANIISLTPGTLCLHVSEDKQKLYLHVLDIKDAEALRRDIKRRIEQRVIGVMR